ncbi:putative powdery mildew resistance protein, RPW8 [Helianthus annuus]|uniref:Powdery mildew resistance protein, RPW8 n=2 Tax=Helianthus annuus TaxID=4232 RepID=A0A9K3JFD0_HELAN|nr:probable disease resistance protein At5g66900 [Helianthus annuus]KAF5814173.1 putative powdery mildew resistance protein, RPW8 [Helianthus annuus]KAJ0592845.1 putative powdery mildew resistance protein, RPW8 [Helianthus annuus]KAJ0600519.1 putative powdery mildew resistance protein, RPW8 [Helianthus annuus]KAJ0607846.1 putative powdery mildew resistance protein, RPW8 [Helianthus annuus]KAJ0767910.1 putative powdery mildew resistance protein, RPW8 [Helianthus annuus]
MAELLGALLGEAVSRVSSVIIAEIEKTCSFKTELTKIKERVESMRPIAERLDKLNKQLDGLKEEKGRFTSMLEQAEVLAKKCSTRKLHQYSSYASKLDKMNRSLQEYVNTDLQFQIALDTKETLVEVRDLKRRREKGSSSGWRTSVPLLKGDAIGFDSRVTELKGKVLKDSPKGDCSVVVVSAMGGSGKTTLVTLFCRDPEIQRRFDRNIYHVTVSERYDIKVIITKLLDPSPNITNNEEAIQQWGSFLAENDQSEILLVLDDVWSESVITDLMFKSPRYKILVTSRMTFKRFETYQLQALNNEDATRLFCDSAFSKNENENDNIRDERVHQLVKCCKNHPLALSVMGGSLKGEPSANWDLMIQQLYKETTSLLDLHESVQICLKKSLYFFEEESEMKKCYLDLGLFPEAQKIAATTLLDMWAHLHNHDEGGLPTFNILTKLSSRNFATLLPISKHSTVVANYCEEESVVQHDMMRALAIQLSSEEPLERRERLIINTNSDDLLNLPQIVNARILSICTGLTTDERFPSTWNEIEAPNVEVFVLNYMSIMHPLPQFMHNMKSLKVLIITNYGYDCFEIQNLPKPRYLSGLTRIRLDHVSISSIISTTILMLENLKKLSLIMCKIGNSFNQGTPNKLTSLCEIDIDSCDDLLTFPTMLCNVVSLKKLRITNCHELTLFSEEFGSLLNLEVLRVASCTKLIALPESMRNLKKLRIIDLSDCLNLKELPLHIGELGSLQTIDVTGCEGLRDQLPKSLQDFDKVKVKVVCDEETSKVLTDFKNVKVVEKDPVDILRKIIGYI